MPALPAEKSVTTPAGQLRTTRLRRHEQHPRLIPAPGVTFADLGVPAPLVATLAEDGITAPFPVQAATASPGSAVLRSIAGPPVRWIVPVTELARVPAPWAPPAAAATKATSRGAAAASGNFRGRRGRGRRA